MKNKKMGRRLVFAIFLVVLAFAIPRWASASTVFADDFSSGTLSNWPRAHMTAGASQTVNGGVARFIVPTPVGGSVTNSYLVKNGFTSTVNSTIIASQDILVAQVPSGCAEGNGAIFFLYVCDSADLGGNLGNIGVGIDGSGVWSLWIGGNTTYVYIFQTSGPLPSSNVWYHVALTVDNSAGTTTLAVDGKVVISATQQQFTDRTHQFSLMSGLGEDWWSGATGPLRIDVDNVRLDVSDADSFFTLNPSWAPATTSPQDGTTSTSTQSPNHSPTAAPTPRVSSSPLPFPTQPPTMSASPTDQQTSREPGFPVWVAVPIVVAIAIFGGVLFMLKKR